MSTRKLGIKNELAMKKAPKFLSITTSKYENDWLSSNHNHDFAEIFYVKRGSGRMQIEGDHIVLKSGHVIVINSQVQHREISDQATPLEYYVIGVSALQVKGEKSKNYSVYKSVNNNTVRIFEEIFREMNNRLEAYQDVCQKYLEILILQLNRKKEGQARYSEEQKDNHECHKIKSYIEQNYQNDISLDSLAQLCNLSKYYLSHKFRAVYNISPIAYLNRVRIEVCKDLLRTTNHSIEEIAAMTGFSSRSYLSQAFLKHCQMTPQSYRKLNQ